MLRELLSSAHDGGEMARGTRGIVHEGMRGITGGIVLEPPVDAPTLAQLGLIKKLSAQSQHSVKSRSRFGTGFSAASFGGTKMAPPNDALTLAQFGLGISKKQDLRSKDLVRSRMLSAVAG